MINVLKASTVKVHLFSLTEADNAENLAVYHAQQKSKDAEYQPGFVELNPLGTYGYVDTADGMFVLDKDGVGASDPLKDGEKMFIQLHASTYKNAEHEGPHTFDISPSVVIQLTPVAIQQRATGETVLLHDFIRKFGSRLESNYRVWKNALEAAS